VKKCLIEDAERRNIKAIECIKLINKKNRFPVLLVVGIMLILSLFLIWTNKMKTSQNSTTHPKILKHDTILIKQNPKNRTIQEHKQEVIEKGMLTKPIIKEVNNQLKDSVDENIRLAIKKRLKAINVLLTSFSNINEFNIVRLRESFGIWKEACNQDCELFYKDYESQISYKRFKSIYNTELDVYNSPIQKRLDEFK
jgi:hypothetical protein